MQIEKMQIDTLQEAAYNPRKDLKSGDPEYEKLRRSVKEFGYVEPAVWNKRTGNIVGGHQRIKVLKDLGYKEIDCVVIDIDATKEKALNIALNKISGEWDENKLTDLLKELQLSGYDTALTGFDIKEIDELFAGTVYDVKEDNFDAEKELGDIDKPFTKQGDIWQIGQHRLMCGDCTAEADVKLLFNNKTADLIVTDPPYNIDYGTADNDRAEARGGEPTDRHILNDNMDDESFYRFLFSFYKVTYGIVKGGGVMYIFHSAKESVNFINAMKQAGFKVSQTLIWVKDHFTLGRSDYQWQYEPILYGWKTEEGFPHYFIHDRTQSSVFENKTDWNRKKKEELLKILEEITTNCPSDIIRDNKPLRNSEHPTMKPITLCAKLVQNSSRINEIVYDAFAGSGSTLMAAQQMNRISYNMELDEKYCDVIVKRYAKIFGTAEINLERNGKTIPFIELERQNRDFMV
jgi:DNA modification methylase